MTALDGLEIEFTNLSNKSIGANNEQVKFTEFFLQGSILDSAVETIKQRLTSICDSTPGEEFLECENIFILGDANQIQGLQSKPARSNRKKNKDDSLDSIGRSPQAGGPHSNNPNIPVQSPMSVMAMTPGTPGMANANNMNFKPIQISTTRHINQNQPNSSKPYTVKYYGNLIDKGDIHNRKKTDKPVLIRPCVISLCSESVLRLIKDCWGFTLTADFACKGIQFVKSEVDYKRNLVFYIKVRVFKILRKNETNQAPLDPQTKSHLIDVSMISPYSGDKELLNVASNVLKNFCDQLKPLVNLDKVF